MVKNNLAVLATGDWVVRGSKTEGKKLVADVKKLILRSFNNECDYCVDHVTFSNIESSEKRIEKTYEELNKLGSFMQAQISSDYKKLKFDEIYLAHEYQEKKQEEKEEQKRIREELREQQKVEAEIKEARDRIAKEKKHFSQELNKMDALLKLTSNEAEKALISLKIQELNAQLGELDKEEKVIDYREKNAKAGFVYIISNIGAFGEDVFKIGMTRRLDPVERIDELGDASVPFSFDTHAMIFSDNAPALEAKIHEHFEKNRINKLNNKKEFFKVNILDVEKVVRAHYDKIVDIVKDPPAEQYRESLLMD